MCCGSKRLAMRNTINGARAISTTALSLRTPAQHIGATTAPISARGSSLSVTLRYMESSAIRVTGPVTGRLYIFSAAQSAQAVDPRDAAALMRSGMFQPA